MTTTEPPAPNSPENPPVELLTQVKMAQRLGVSRRTVHNWTRDGVIPMIKVRGFCRFEPAKVWAALLQHESTKGAAK